MPLCIVWSCALYFSSLRALSQDCSGDANSAAFCLHMYVCRIARCMWAWVCVCHAWWKERATRRRKNKSRCSNIPNEISLECRWGGVRAKWTKSLFVCSFCAPFFFVCTINVHVVEVRCMWILFMAMRARIQFDWVLFYVFNHITSNESPISSQFSLIHCSFIKLIIDFEISTEVHTQKPASRNFVPQSSASNLSCARLICALNENGERASKRTTDRVRERNGWHVCNDALAKRKASQMNAFLMNISTFLFLCTGQISANGKYFQLHLVIYLHIPILPFALWTGRRCTKARLFQSILWSKFSGNHIFSLHFAFAWAYM